MKNSKLPNVVFQLILTFGIALQLGAQPSGGPYGPISTTYTVPTLTEGKVIYVAPDAAASNEGATLDQATSIGAAFEKAKTNDVIVLRGGVYRTGDLKTNQGITLQPYLNEIPVLKGSLVASMWEKQKNGIWKTTWKKLYPEAAPDWWRKSSWGKVTSPWDFNYDMVFVDGKPLKTVGWEGALDETSFCIDYKSGNVYIAFDPSEHLIEITAFDNAITRVISNCHGKESDTQGIKVKGTTFTQYAYRAIEIEGTEAHSLTTPDKIGKDVVGSLFENVTITYCSRVAGYFRGDDLVIRNCLISHTGMEGIYVISSGNILLENNIVTHTNIENLQGVFSTAIKIFNQCYNAVCRNNLIIDNENSSGIWYDVGNVNGTFYNNWIENTDNGFFFEISKNAVCAGNVFINCNTGIQVRNSSNTQIYCNTFFNSSIYVYRDTRSAENDHFGWHPSAGPDVDEREGHEIGLNLFVADGELEIPMVRISQHHELKGVLTTSPMTRFDNNSYICKNEFTAALIEWSPTQSDTGNTQYATLSDFQKVQLDFETKSQSRKISGACFQSEALKNFELLDNFQNEKVTASDLPEIITNLLPNKLNSKSPVGAY